MADVFEWGGALTSERQRLWELIAATPNLDWLLLTKRPHLIERLAPWTDDWPANVWLGVTVEDQHFAGKRIKHLIDIPAHVRFLSCEPLLGPVDLSEWIEDLNWVIAGGESGPHARQSSPSWFRGLRDQCQEAGVGFHFKQWGDWFPLEESPEHVRFERRGKAKAGRVLDDRTWDEAPNVA
jgi:protein gp37